MDTHRQLIQLGVAHIHVSAFRTRSLAGIENSKPFSNVVAAFSEAQSISFISYRSNMELYICCTAVDAVAAVILCPCYIYCGPFIAHSINYIHEIYFHQIAFKRLILMLLLNVQPSVKHHRFNRQIHNHLNHFPEPGKCSLSVC